ncbi:MAG: hypothetical protein RSC76_03245 [Oscillospiraceae bacterium]
MTAAIYIRGISLPTAVRGVTVEDADGNYNVYVNTRLCPAARQEAARHELKHIRLGHFCDFNPVIINELEVQA